ncbi:polysaccharide biosynthesis protein [Novosphingobium sp. TH158]|nr:polysaccharide biosynthesis protein [Novosphingobium sp. TH158]
MSVRGAALWAMGGQYLSFAIQFVTSVLISRFFLSPEEVGLFSIAMAAALLASVLQDFGLSRYIAGLPRIDKAEIARCSSVAHAFSLVVAGLIAASAWPMAEAYDQPDLLPIMLIIASSYLFIPFAVVPLALLGRTMTFTAHFKINVGGALAQGLVSLGFAAAGFSAYALAWGTLAFALVRGAIAQWIRPASPWPLQLDGMKPIVSTGSRLTTLYAIGAAGSRSPDLIVGKALGLLAVGLYSRAASLADQFRMLIAGAIGSVFYPAFARIRDRGEPLGPAYLRVCAGYSAVVWPGMAGLALASEPVVRLLYGEAWIGVAPLLAMIALSEILLVSLPLHTDLPILTGKLNQLIRVNLIDTLMAIAVLVAGCAWGLEGAAGSRLVYGAAWVLLYARFLHRLIGFDAKALLGIYARSALATLAALVPLALTYAFIVPPSQIGFFTLAAAAGAGVLLWLGCLALLRHPALDDLLGIAAHIPFASRILPIARLAR